MRHQKPWTNLLLHPRLLLVLALVFLMFLLLWKPHFFFSLVLDYMMENEWRSGPSIESTQTRTRCCILHLQTGNHDPLCVCVCVLVWFCQFSLCLCVYIRVWWWGWKWWGLIKRYMGEGGGGGMRLKPHTSVFVLTYKLQLSPRMNQKVPVGVWVCVNCV